jgi:hypothetical protein
MAEDNPTGIEEATNAFKGYLRGTATGGIVLRILEYAACNRTFSIDCFTFNFDKIHRSDFQQLLVPPYVDCLKEAASQIDQHIKLQCRNFEDGMEDQILLEHTEEGIQIRRKSCGIDGV